MTGSYPPTAPYPSLAERAARYSFYPIYYTHAWSGAFRCILYLHSVVLSSQATQCKVNAAGVMQQIVAWQYHNFIRNVLPKAKKKTFLLSCGISFNVVGIWINVLFALGL